MCKPVSMILLRDKVYYSDVINSHGTLLNELGIKDNSKTPDFVRIEITPPNGDFFAQTNEWNYKVGQDYMPSWYVEEYDKKRAYEALSKWATEHVFIGVDNLKFTDKKGLYIKDCKDISLNGDSIVEEMRGDSIVKDMRGSSIVKEMRGSSIVKNMYNNSVVKYMLNNSIVEHMYDDSVVEHMYNNSIVEYMYDNSVVKNMYNNSVVRNMCCNSAVENMYGNSVVVSMYENSVIRQMYDNSIIINMYGISEVKNMYDNSEVKCMYENSVIKKMYDDSLIFIDEKHLEFNAEYAILHDNATIKDKRTKTIYQCGCWSFKESVECKNV